MKLFSLRWATIALLCGVIIPVTGSRAAAGTIQATSPSSTANVEGNADQRPALIPVRIQHLIPASDFANIPASHRLLVGFNFRADRSQTQSIEWGTGEERIWMSTTDKDILTTTFDSNHGADRALVHDGPIKYPLLATGPAAGPRDIAPSPRLQTPFYYDPTQGNLLIDRLSFVTDPSAQATIDTQLTSLARVLINDVNPNSATGTLFATEVAVFPFEFAAIPEPSTLVLAGSACLCLFAWRRRK